MLSVEEALQRVLAGVAPVSAETIPLPAALGRVLAEPVAARIAHPPLDVSMMDGYAVRAADIACLPTSLPVIGESAAGHPFAGTLAPGQALRIFTGAAVPPGADTVVMQEDATRSGDTVTLTADAPAGRYIRRAGQDFTAGQVLLQPRTVLGPRQIALAAAMNVPWLGVRRRPRVAVLSTGDEIAMPGEPLGAAQLPSSNGLGIAAMVAALGGEAVQLGIARDSRESLSALVAAAQGCDLLVTSGGASVGDYDLVQSVLAEHGMELDFWRIAMRPGKALMFGRLGRIPVLGVPGNPVAAMVCAQIFLSPLLRALQGLPAATPPLAATLGAPLPANDLRQDYMRAALDRAPDGTLVATPHSRQDSAMVSGLAAAQALIVRPPHAPAAAAGTVVPVHPLDF